MRYTVVLEYENGNYRAFVPALPECIAKGRTREEALNNIQQAIVECLSHVEIMTVEIEAPPGLDPWEPFIGMWADDESWDEFQAEIEAYRRQVNGRRKETGSLSS